jgi:hypothetical protein
MKKWFWFGYVFGLVVTFEVEASSTLKYKSYFDGVYTANKSGMDALAASGNGHTYYQFQYFLMGTLGMFEGTRDTTYLTRALAWAETMISKATIRGSDGYLYWTGRWCGNPYSSLCISHNLDDFQGSTELARLARIILTDPDLKSAYGARAQAIFNFVKTQIVDKDVFARGDQQWFIDHAGWNSAYGYNDKAALLTRILVNLLQAGLLTDSKYRDLTLKMLQGFKNRLIGYSSGSLIWDRLRYNDSGGSGTQYSLDTSHANRWPILACDAMRAGFIISQTEVSGLALLLTRVMWNQSTSNPHFTNYIDGNNTAGFGGAYPPWALGLVFQGWFSLGAHDSQAQAVGEALMDAIVAGTSNPNNYLDGRIALAGQLVMNLRIINSGVTPIPVVDTMAPTVRIISPANGTVIPR